MPTPVREQVLAAIATAVGGEHQVPAPVDETDLPWTSIADGQDSAEAITYDRSDITMEISIGRGQVATGSSREALRRQGNEILADLIVEMYADETFGGLADQVNYTGGFIEAEMGKLCIAVAQFKVSFHHRRGDPFTKDES